MLSFRPVSFSFFAIPLFTPLSNSARRHGKAPRVSGEKDSQLQKLEATKRTGLHDLQSWSGRVARLARQSIKQSSNVLRDVKPTPLQDQQFFC